MAKKRKFMVIARNQKTQQKGIVTGKGHRTFGEKSVLWISDPAEAREIETGYSKRDVAVTTDQQYEWSLNNENGDGTKLNNIHNYTFGQLKEVKWVWVKTDEGKIKQTRLDWAKEFGWKILPQKPKNGRKGAEVKNGV